jgi:hypothetical protein
MDAMRASGGAAMVTVMIMMMETTAVSRHKIRVLLASTLQLQLVCIRASTILSYF